ncbi:MULTISPECIES: transcription/translation regulatory transformer protein RfaH [unclassified Agrobacterium]|uniref:transcription/translation regulatory transformer protein RfaH n=1 Tax=unclassified Agrobacterium TaxID=2632611 RepID=UPI00083E1C2D|nr:MULTISPECIES: transcription/translation regulatory transformer protein RfaH [unclassified Agrobacterium]AOG12610.1 transcription elongation factor/antiterminator RfaH [Agrobacterium sp. RAC06]QGG93491.1 transcription/translation regulatory transformer protein RfaH [Agrobacterium sp. MA01]
MHWYLVHTKPRRELCALENLERQGYECYLPAYTAEVVRSGTLEVAVQPLFPRYLFVRLGRGPTAKSWTPIRSTIGVSRLVSFGTEPTPVDDRLIEILKAREARHGAEPVPLFRSGEKVALTHGAFDGIEGVYQMTDGDRRAMVLIELLSRRVVLRVASSSLRKVP